MTFDEVAGIDFKDKDGIQIMKDYMALPVVRKNWKAGFANIGCIMLDCSWKTGS